LGRYILFIAAAGNNGRNTGGYWPACHGNIMAVAAHDASGARSVWGPGSSSNYQSYVDISAPGTNLWSTDMVGNTPVHNYYRGYLPSPYHVRTNFGGTSGASPVVAGVAILVTSKWPSLWPQLVRWRITSTASFDLPDPNVNQFGRVDADSAL
jgi:subtilisin family serine protease